VFTDSNAGSYYFNDYTDFNQLNEVDWNAVNALLWSGCREKKQAEFLIEYSFPWQLFEFIGVHSPATYKQVNQALRNSTHHPRVEIKSDWYY
jgi:hypothetical protein